MTDQRCRVVITFNFHNKDYKFNACINWFPDEYGVDERVVEFFRDATADGLLRYHEACYEAEREERERRQERDERATLDALTKKYGPPHPTPTTAEEK
jgi:hypothetical protein